MSRDLIWSNGSADLDQKKGPLSTDRAILAPKKLDGHGTRHKLPVSLGAQRGNEQRNLCSGHLKSLADVPIR